MRAFDKVHKLLKLTFHPHEIICRISILRTLMGLSRSFLFTEKDEEFSKETCRVIIHSIVVSFLLG